MKRKILITLCILMTIGSWMNLFYGMSAYSLITSVTNWDAIKVIIDFLVATCWTVLSIFCIRRK